MKLLNRLAIWLIKFYRRKLSRKLWFIKCKYEPTCSEYSLEAYKKYSFIKATWMTAWRLMRCNPFSKGGYDPVK